MVNHPKSMSVPRCHYCGRLLDFQHDYSCISCSMQTCDNCSVACQEEDCDLIACSYCMSQHVEAHEMESASYWFTLPVHSATIPPSEGYSDLRATLLGNLAPLGNNSVMYEDTIAQRLAQEGLRNIENAILRLLNANPSGLRNVDIANMLNLHSEIRGQHRNYLTRSVLGGLEDRGLVAQDRETSLFTRAQPENRTLD